jgi:hypothetical protein
MKFSPVILIFIILFGFSACKHDIPLEPDPNPNPIDSGGGNNNGIVCFESDILPIFQGSCAVSGCHDAVSQQDGIRLFSYSGIMEEIVPNQPGEGDIMEAIMEGDPDKLMPPPPRPRLTGSQIATIQLWIQQGAQNTINCSSATCDSTLFTYSAGIAPIMATHCNGCHSGASPSAGISTNSHASLATIAASGQLLGSIDHITPYSFMPKNASKLDICKRTIIRKWINAGAPNN